MDSYSFKTQKNKREKGTKRYEQEVSVKTVCNVLFQGYVSWCIQTFFNAPHNTFSN